MAARRLRENGASITVITGGEVAHVSAEPDLIRIPSSSTSFGPSVPGRALNWWRKRTNEVNPLQSWIRHAIHAAVTEIDRKRPDVLLTMSTPFHAHMVGLALRQRYSALPWAAYFSDPAPIGLVGGYWRRYRLPGLYQYQRRQTRQVLQTADRLLLTNELASSSFTPLVGADTLAKARVIRHIAEPIENDAEPELGWLTHIGSIDLPRCCLPLLRAVKQLASNDTHFRGLRSVGTVNPRFLQQAEQVGASPGLTPTGPVSHQQAQVYSQTAQALLVIEADLPVSYFSPSKLAEYAFHGRPIFAITPPSSTIRSLMASHPVGTAVDWHAPDLATRLAQFWAETQTHSLDGFEGLQGLFSAKKNAELLLEAVRDLRR